MCQAGRRARSTEPSNRLSRAQIKQVNRIQTGQPPIIRKLQTSNQKPIVAHNAGNKLRHKLNLTEDSGFMPLSRSASKTKTPMTLLVVSLAAILLSISSAVSAKFHQTPIHSSRAAILDANMNIPSTDRLTHAESLNGNRVATKSKPFVGEQRPRFNRSQDSTLRLIANRSLASGPVRLHTDLDLESSANLEVLRSPKPMHNNSMVRRPVQSLPEMSFRHSVDAAANSTGNMMSPVADNQWIPIRAPDGSANNRNPFAPARPQNMSRQQVGAPRTPQLYSPALQAASQTSRRRPPATNASQPQRRPALQAPHNRHANHRPAPQPPPVIAAEGSRNRNFYQPVHHYEHRRPRVNLAPDELEVQAKGMYKKVLLCDKTLVSLDYVRNVDLEPRFYGPSYEDSGNYNGDDDNFADNFIDLDSNVELNILPIRRQSVSNTTSSDTSSFDEPLSSSAAGQFERRGQSGREPYLSDEDALVKCDMWDLEKGLKNRKPPEGILRMAIKADFDTVRDAINRCRQLSERILPPEDEYRDHGIEVMSTEDLISLFSMKRGLIPGTKWCGLGDQASHYNDLGPKHRIDICCRAHDHCPIRLKPFRNDYGVLNIALYTKSHCDCDADFYRCLREVRSRTADMLGNLYFNVMKLQCMREERMKVCREMKPIALGFERCVRYEESPIKTVFKFTTPPVAY